MTKVIVYPADSAGCGHFRLIWPGERLADMGYDVTVLGPGHRDIKIKMAPRSEEVLEVLDVDPDAVYVFQRLTHNRMAQAVTKIREKGAAVVVDVDDDLSSIHPKNPAYDAYHPKRGDPMHSWRNLARACQDATLVTVSTPGLLGIYARHGRGHVIYNHLPDPYFEIEHEDSDRIGWPASLHSHPDDPSALGGAMARLCGPERPFQVVGDPSGVADAFSLRDGLLGVSEQIGIREWPRRVSDLVGIGIAPLADTRFNDCKSWLKPLEMSALGIPWVASPSVEYLRLIGRGHDGDIGAVAGTSRRWHKELNRLVTSKELRLERAGRARAVAETLRIRNNAWRWLEAWDRARSIQDGEPARTQLV
jgi:hypothetical protein